MKLILSFHVIIWLSLLLSTPCNGLVNRGGRLFSSVVPLDGPIVESQSSIKDVDTAAKLRYTCKKFKRYDALDGAETITASLSDPTIVKQALDCLDVARLSPNSFNTQPYKIILVHSPEKKLALSKCVLGPNGQRVRDSDCTAVFLADKRICSTFQQMTDFIKATSAPNRIPTLKLLLKMKLYITIFSSGYPLPRILASPISFLVRTAISITNCFTRKFYLLPSLSSAETWATKQTMLVAMTYMLCCSSRGLATAPMEGFNAAAIRKQLNIPSRYAIPVIISTGLPYKAHDDTNVTIRRYPKEEVIYGDTFGEQLQLQPSL
jgi:nitroreductase